MKTFSLIVGLFFTTNIFSQTVDSVLIKGLLLTKDKCPIEKSEIRIIDTKILTTTDNKGYFEINAPIEGVVSFSIDSNRYVYGISTIDGILGQANVNLTFIFENVLNNHDCLKGKPIGKVVKIKAICINNDKEFIEVACYYTNFRKLTQHYFDIFKANNYAINLIINGRKIDFSTGFKEINYDLFKSVYILRNSKNFNEYTVLISYDEG